MPYIAPEVLYGEPYIFRCTNEDNKEEYGYKGKEIKAAFEEADKEILNISTSYEKNTDAVYTSRAFSFSNLLSKPVNSSIITSYINNEVLDVDDESKLVDNLVN
ncbi:hypothetical protein RhiirA1_460703 [Rhizophagus irregularis]|uniref:Uncharacterized protein n=1 Tax=Rhizophagus irregularis TaxID=588596 RepID=A0A2N0RQY0_9GLOM|nr:hypothetical protein RhiirA1_460703 [Rhizophagus irregularis]